MSDAAYSGQVREVDRFASADAPVPPGVQTALAGELPGERARRGDEVNAPVEVRMGNSRREARLVRKLAEGGEGSVFSTSIPGYVAKIYRREKLTADRRAKLELMCAHPVHCEGVCFPQALVFNRAGEFVGYLMRRATGVELGRSVFVKKLLLQKFPDWTRRDTIRLCMTLLEKIAYLNDRGVILGDINPQNILVVGPDEVYFVDCDSYQMGGYPCPVGTVNFTPPEAQGCDYKTFLRTQQMENFAVATLLFMIMLPGKTPYSAVGGESQAANIVSGNFPYPHSGEDGSKMPRGAWGFIWSQMSFRVREAFYQTFQKGEAHFAPDDRLGPAEWLDLFSAYYHGLDYMVRNDPQAVDIFPTHLKMQECKHEGCTRRYVPDPYSYSPYCDEHRGGGVYKRKRCKNPTCGNVVVVTMADRGKREPEYCSRCWQKEPCSRCGSRYAKWMLDEHDGMCASCWNARRRMMTPAEREAEDAARQAKLAEARARRGEGARAAGAAGAAAAATTTHVRPANTAKAGAAAPATRAAAAAAGTGKTAKPAPHAAGAAAGKPAAGKGASGGAAAAAAQAKPATAGANSASAVGGAAKPARSSGAGAAPGAAVQAAAPKKPRPAKRDEGGKQKLSRRAKKALARADRERAAAQEAAGAAAAASGSAPTGGASGGRGAASSSAGASPVAGAPSAAAQAAPDAPADGRRDAAAAPSAGGDARLPASTAPGPGGGQAEAAAKTPVSRRALIGGAAAAVALLAVGVAVGRNLGGASGDAAPSPAGAPGAPAPDAPQPAPAADPVAGVAVLDAANDYTWEELSIVARAMSDAGSRAAALSLAAAHHLVEPDGTLSALGVKNCEMADGTVVAFRIVDVYREQPYEGGNPCGLVFMAQTAVAAGPLNSFPFNAGGWAGSEARTWLNSDFLYGMLPTDLASVMRTVAKPTNNYGMVDFFGADATGLVSLSPDLLWLPSFSELCGDVAEDGSTNVDVAVATALNAEASGGQLAWYAQAGVGSLGGPTAALRATMLDQDDEPAATWWWTRSAYPGGSDSFMCVSDEGDPTQIIMADQTCGLLPAFCL